MRVIRPHFGPSEASRAIHIMCIAFINIGFKRGCVASSSHRSALLTGLVLEIFIAPFDMALQMSFFVKNLTLQRAAALGLYSDDTWIVWGPRKNYPVGVLPLSAPPSIQYGIFASWEREAAAAGSIVRSGLFTVRSIV